MRRKLSLFLLPVFFLYAAISFAAVSGQVTDAAKNNVPDAQVVFIDEANPDNIATATTDANGMYQVELTTGVETQIPETFTLKQNFPNPFNPTTTIPFSLREAGKVDLVIYNIMGQKVKTLVSRILSAGEHNVVWNGRDDNGRGVSAGVYIYRLKCSGFSKANKMLLLDGGGNVVSNDGPVLSSTYSFSTSTAKIAASSYTIRITGATIDSLEMNGVQIADGQELNLIAVNKDVVVVAARMIAKEGMVDSVKAILLPLVEQTRQEEGNITYDLLQTTADSTIFLLYEEWRNEDAITTHMSTDYFNDFYSKVNDLFIADGGLVVTRYKEISAPRADNINNPELISVITRLECKEGMSETALETMKPFIQKTREEPGALGYDLHRSTEDPSVFMLYENWAGQSAVDYHLGTDFFQDFYAQFGTLFNVVQVNISKMLTTPEY